MTEPKNPSDPFADGPVPWTERHKEHVTELENEYRCDARRLADALAVRLSDVVRLERRMRRAEELLGKLFIFTNPMLPDEIAVLKETQDHFVAARKEDGT